MEPVASAGSEASVDGSAGEDGTVGLVAEAPVTRRASQAWGRGTLPATVVMGADGDVGVAEGHDEGDGVVGSDVGVDEEITRRIPLWAWGRKYRDFRFSIFDFLDLGERRGGESVGIFLCF